MCPCIIVNHNLILCCTGGFNTVAFDYCMVESGKMELCMAIDSVHAPNFIISTYFHDIISCKLILTVSDAMSQCTTLPT